jgi:Mg2+-importing ATPase
VGALTEDDEREMIFVGYLAFLDPPKASAASALAALSAHGVGTKVLTGDAAPVACYVLRAMNVPVTGVLTGSEVEALDDDELRARVEATTVFAKLAPDQKARVVSALRELGHVVGYMGDGVNDAAAMRASDCGISVDSAVDVARESADIILLEKDLQVLERGIQIGRRTYTNTAKYLKLTVSGNFGNIFSVLLASAFLPFLPMAPVQLLLLNLVNDVISAGIPWDNVDEEQVARPRVWETGSVRSFMQWFGPTSTLLDLATFAALFFVVCPAVCGGPWWSLETDAARAIFAATFQAGWLVESLWTQVLVVHVMRTERIPLWQSRASWQLSLLGLLGLAFVTALPFTPLATGLDLAPLPGVYWGWLAVLVAAYLVLVAVVKRAYLRRFGELL